MEINLMADRFGAQAFRKDDYLLVRIEKKEKAAQTFYFPQTTEILISRSASLRSSSPPSATVTRSS